MISDPWGRDDPPAVDPATLPPLPASLSFEALVARRPRSFAAPEELPEVAALVADGWEPLEEAPLYANVPTAWPAELRCWVPDRLPRVLVGVDATGAVVRAEPWDAQTYAELAEDRAQAAREAGLEPPPPGRLWLLRSPFASVRVPVLLALAGARVLELGGQDASDDVLRGVRDVLAMAEEELWDWWAPAPDHPARRWRARGRTGRDVVPYLLADIGPEDVDRLLAPPPDGAGLTAAEALRWCEAVGEGEDAVAHVLGWRRLGLPATPPDTGLLFGTDPADVTPWLEAGFALADVERLGPFGLPVALAWHAAGVDAATAAALLAADPAVTPAEAAAFEAAGITGDARTGWLEGGFDVAAALGWTAAGVLPNEARVWRAEGLGPDDAAPLRPADPHAPFIPPDAAVGWFSFGTSEPGRGARGYGVSDPPGTRGRLAAGRDGHDWS